MPGVTVVAGVSRGNSVIIGEGVTLVAGVADTGSAVLPNLLETFGADLQYWHKPWEADGITLNGSNAAAITDYSGNSRSFTQSNPANQPAVATVGALRGLDFNNAAAVLFIGGAGVALAQPYYFMFVVRPNASPSAAQNRHVVYDTGNAAVRWRESDLEYQAFPGSTAVSEAGSLDSAVSVLAYLDGTNSWVEVDGVRSAIGGSGTAALAGVFSCYGTGGGFGANDSFVGQLFEGALVSGAQSDATLLQARLYLDSIAAQVNA